MEKINFYVTPEEKIKIRTFAATQDVSMTEIVHTMIEICFQQIKERGYITDWLEENGH